MEADRPGGHHPRIPLRNFRIEALDVNDAVLSKLKRYSSDDANDIRAMADNNLIDHELLIDHFKAAVDWFSLDARAPEVPLILARLHRTERDVLGVDPTDIELPPECSPD